MDLCAQYTVCEFVPAIVSTTISCLPTLVGLLDADPLPTHTTSSFSLSLTLVWFYRHISFHLVSQLVITSLWISRLELTAAKDSGRTMFIRESSWHYCEVLEYPTNSSQSFSFFTHTHTHICESTRILKLRKRREKKVCFSFCSNVWRNANMVLENCLLLFCKTNNISERAGAHGGILYVITGLYKFCLCKVWNNIFIESGKHQSRYGGNGELGTKYLTLNGYL